MEITWALSWMQELTQVEHQNYHGRCVPHTQHAPACAQHDVSAGYMSIEYFSIIILVLLEYYKQYQVAPGTTWEQANISLFFHLAFFFFNVNFFSFDSSVV